MYEIGQIVTLISKYDKTEIIVTITNIKRNTDPSSNYFGQLEVLGNDGTKTTYMYSGNEINKENHIWKEIF